MGKTQLFPRIAVPSAPANFDQANRYRISCDQVRALCESPAEFQSILISICSRYGIDNPNAQFIPLGYLIDKLNEQREALSARALQAWEIQTQDGVFQL